MKRGLLMSFALISVLASILFLAAELRNISYEVTGQTDTAPDHSLFMKTVITGHRLWMIEMQDKIRSLNKERKKNNLIPIKVGMGINRGVVVSGNIGSRDMMDYTVIGDTVNLGARLCSYAKPDEIIVSKTVWNKTKERFNYEKLEPIKVKGKKSKVLIYTIKSN